jgi:NAD(P)-dependent dehydrogenase (short-subunit alcohol dehydrogenase family)
MGRLQGKVIIVAGAGGIGDGCARHYAAEGASILLGDLDAASAEATAAAIIADGGKAIGVALDGSDEASIVAAVGRARAEFGGVDGVHVNFASFSDSETGDVLDLPIDVFDEVMRVNARGFLLFTRAALPALLARGGGSIIYTSSGAAHMPMASRVAYTMSKAAGHALMRHVATRFGAQGIRANVIAPGPIAHPRFEAVLDPDFIAQMASGTAVGRLGRPLDIAALGALLLSDEGSFITGQVLSVDGGASMRP